MSENNEKHFQRGAESASSSSSSSSSFANSTGASISSSATASNLTTTISVSKVVYAEGADSSSSSASASASDQGVTAEAETTVKKNGDAPSAQAETAVASQSLEQTLIEGVSADGSQPQRSAILLVGTAINDLLVSTPQREIFWGGAGADIFQLSSTGVAELNQADIILDYNPTEGDYLALRDTLTPDALIFEVIDFGGNGTADSTVVRSSIDNTILAIVLNTVSDLGEPLLSTADFLEPAAVEAWVASNTLPELETEAEPGTSSSSQTSSSSSAYVDGSGAGSSSSATATSATGETSTSSETVYTPGASSSGGTATATANPEGVNTTASAQAPLLDVLIGTAENDVLVGTNNRNIFIGNGGADIFVLFATKKTSLETADIIVDFSPEQGDLIQLPSGIALSDITLQAVDIDSNGTLDGTSIGAVETGAIYAIVLGTVDSLGTSTLAAESFIAPNFT